MKRVKCPLYEKAVRTHGSVLWVNEEATENLIIGIRQQTNIDNIILNVYFLSFSQEEKIKRPSLENRKNVSLTEPCPPDFSLSKGYCKGNRTNHTDPVF